MAENKPPHQAETQRRQRSESATLDPVRLPTRNQELESIVASYEGPLPLPSHIEHYNNVLPGAAERIMAMSEAEQRSRLSLAQHESLVATDLARQEAALQRTSIVGRLRLEGLGLVLGFLTTVMVVCAAFGFAYFAPEKIEKVGALMIGFTYAAATLIGAFRRNRAQKSDAAPDGQTKSNPRRKRK